MEQRNLTLLTDFYELTMGNGYFLNGLQDQIVYFDMFFREIPDDGGFVIMAGLEQLIDYLKNLKFTEEDIDYLRSKGMFDEGFWNIFVILSLNVMYGQFRKGAQYFQGNHW